LAKASCLTKRNPNLVRNRKLAQNPKLVTYRYSTKNRNSVKYRNSVKNQNSEKNIIFLLMSKFFQNRNFFQNAGILQTTGPYCHVEWDCLELAFVEIYITAPIHLSHSIPKVYQTELFSKIVTKAVEEKWGKIPLHFHCDLGS